MTPAEEARLVEDISREMTDEIDQAILCGVKAMQDLHSRKVDLAIGNALEAARHGELYPHLHDEIMSTYRNKGIEEQGSGILYHEKVR